MGNMCPASISSSDWQLLNLEFPSNNVENQVSWLISTFVDIVWTEFHSAQDALLDVRKVFGYLTFKYRLGQKVIGAIPFLE